MYHPTLNEFREKARRGNLIPVYQEILADLETPVSAFLKIDRGDFSYLLESVTGREHVARYSFLGCSPTVIFRSKGNSVTITTDGNERTFSSDDPLAELKNLMAGFVPVVTESLPRFFGGAVGYLAYDMVRFFERLPDTTVDDLSVPDMYFIITDTILIFDHVNRTVKVVSNAHVKGDPDRAYSEAIAKIKRLTDLLRKPTFSERSRPRATEVAPTLSSNFSEGEFKEAVQRAKEYIAAGDIIQVVLSQRFEIRAEVDPFVVYRALRSVNPSPYMFYLNFGDLKLVGSSPELLVRVEDDLVEERPIAGTRPRGKTQAEDNELEHDLLSDEKERAEHIMLVDLGRNDVGRVCRPGSVEVTELAVVERYSHVMHIVSNVQGRLKAGEDAFSSLRSAFPAGTLSGAPKIRAMEIIEELEPVKRGPYGGALGYFSFSGNLDTAIIIRTLVIKNGRIYLQAGAGIVADSDPQREYEETRNKAKALMKALDLAAKGLEI